MLRTASLKLRPLPQLDTRTQGLGESLDRAIAEVEDCLLGIHRYLDTVSNEMNPERLQSLQERLSLLVDLRRKYGKTTEEILDYFKKIQSELSTLEDDGEKIKVLSEDLSENEKTLQKDSQRLFKIRKKVSELLAEAVSAELKDLKMGEAHLEIEINHAETFDSWHNYGADTVHFLVRTNRGEPCRPLGKIASGGELSRLMLAIRRVIADRGGIGVYLFDEIDAGIGGQTAFQVGKKLASVAGYNQVICITHLPQVAAFANHHLVVKKVPSGKRTVTEILPLNKTERKEELARMLGGPQLTRKSLDNASELLDTAQRGHFSR